MSVIGYINNFESFGAVDGPGVRYVVFMQGCNMRCKYCHNPETWGVYRGADGESGAPQDAHTLTPQDVLDKALRYREYWGEEGGITVSGGEPLLQMDFVTQLFALAHEHGINTCIDTAGQPYSDDKNFQNKFSKLCQVTDLFIVDIKHFDANEHKILTGHTSSNILDMIKHLDELGKKLWVRHVLVPGITDDPQHLQAIAQFLNSLKNVEKREILPYHTLGVPEWERLGLNYQLDDIDPPTKDQIAKANSLLNS